MIRITPAILTSDLNEFLSLFIKYTNTFESIDIDIAEKDFADNQTVSLVDILDTGVIKQDQNIGIHLMVRNPIDQIRYLASLEFKEFENLRIYIHQESEINKVEEFLEIFDIGIVVNKESSLKPLEYYTKFSEVQLMTIEIGKQGSVLDRESLKKVGLLRELGYKGDISLDGGINLETAHLISEANPDRVSVGSYLQNSKDLESDFKKLNELLNN